MSRSKPHDFLQPAWRALFCTIVLIGTGTPAVYADTLVVLNKAEASASLIDLHSGKEVARLETGEGPHEAAVSPDGRTAVVADYGAQTPGSTLTVIDIPSATVTKTIALGAFTRPHGIEYFADGARVAVTAEAQKALIVVNVDAGEVVQAVHTGQEASHMVALAPDGKRAYVANIVSGTTTALDLEAGEHIANVETGAGAEGIGITPDGRQVWVTNREDDTVSVVDTETLEVIASLPSPTFPIRAKVTPDGKWVLVTNPESDDLTVFDAETLSESRRIDLSMDPEVYAGREGGVPEQGSIPIGVLIAPGGKRAYIAHANADRVSVLDLERWQVVERLETGSVPDGLGYSKLSVSK